MYKKKKLKFKFSNRFSLGCYAPVNIKLFFKDSATLLIPVCSCKPLFTLPPSAIQLSFGTRKGGNLSENSKAVGTELYATRKDFKTTNLFVDKYFTTNKFVNTQLSYFLKTYKITKLVNNYKNLNKTKIKPFCFTGTYSSQNNVLPSEPVRAARTKSQWGNSLAGLLDRKTFVIPLGKLYGQKHYLFGGLLSQTEYKRETLQLSEKNFEKNLGININLSENCAQQPGLCTGKAVGTELYATRKNISLLNFRRLATYQKVSLLIQTRNKIANKIKSPQILQNNLLKNLVTPVPDLNETSSNFQIASAPAATRNLKYNYSLLFNKINNKSFLSYWLIPIAGLAFLTKPEQSSGCYAPNSEPMQKHNVFLINLSKAQAATHQNKGIISEAYFLNNLYTHIHTKNFFSKKTLANFFTNGNIVKQQYNNEASTNVIKFLSSENCAQQPELKRFEAVGTELYASFNILRKKNYRSRQLLNFIETYNFHPLFINIKNNIINNIFHQAWLTDKNFLVKFYQLPQKFALAQTSQNFLCCSHRPQKDFISFNSDAYKDQNFLFYAFNILPSAYNFPVDRFAWSSISFLNETTKNIVHLTSPFKSKIFLDNNLNFMKTLNTLKILNFKPERKLRAAARALHGLSHRHGVIRYAQKKHKKFLAKKYFDGFAVAPPGTANLSKAQAATRQIQKNNILAKPERKLRAAARALHGLSRRHEVIRYAQIFTRKKNIAKIAKPLQNYKEVLNLIDLNIPTNLVKYSKNLSENCKAVGTELYATRKIKPDVITNVTASQPYKILFKQLNKPKKVLKNKPERKLRAAARALHGLSRRHEVIRYAPEQKKYCKNFFEAWSSIIFQNQLVKNFTEFRPLAVSCIAKGISIKSRQKINLLGQKQIKYKLNLITFYIKPSATTYQAKLGCLTTTRAEPGLLRAKLIPGTQEFQQPKYGKYFANLSKAQAATRQILINKDFAHNLKLANLYFNYLNQKLKNFAQKNIKGVEPRAYGDTISAQVFLTSKIKITKPERSSGCYAPEQSKKKFKFSNLSKAQAATRSFSKKNIYTKPEQSKKNFYAKNILTKQLLNTISIVFKHQKMFKNLSKAQAATRKKQANFHMFSKKNNFTLSQKKRYQAKDYWQNSVPARSSLSKAQVNKTILGRLHLQKKRKAKKQRLETRRQKKRTRFFPRPNWLRYRLFLAFLKQRNFTSKNNSLLVTNQVAFTGNKGIKIAQKNIKGVEPRAYGYTIFAPAAKKFLAEGKTLTTKNKKIAKFLFQPERKLYCRRHAVIRYAPAKKIIKIFPSFFDKMRTEKKYLRDLKIKANYVNFKNQKTNNPAQTDKDKNKDAIFRDFWVWMYNSNPSKTWLPNFARSSPGSARVINNYNLSKAKKNFTRKKYFTGGATAFYILQNIKKKAIQLSCNIPPAAHYLPEQSSGCYAPKGMVTPVTNLVLSHKIKSRKKYFAKNAFALTRIHWALNKTNNSSFTDYNKRYILWSTQKLRNQSKNNKTKFLEKQFITNWETFFLTKKLNRFYKKITSKLHQKTQKLNYLTRAEPGLLRATYKNLKNLSENIQKQNKFLFTEKLEQLFPNSHANARNFSPFILSKNITMFNSSNYFSNLKLKPLFNTSNNFSEKDKFLSLNFKSNNFQITSAQAATRKNIDFKRSNIYFFINTPSTLIITITALLHFCALLSLISISQVRCFVKFHIILLSKLSNIYMALITTILDQTRTKFRLGSQTNFVGTGKSAKNIVQKNIFSAKLLTYFSLNLLKNSFKTRNYFANKPERKLRAAARALHGLSRRHEVIRYAQKSEQSLVLAKYFFQFAEQTAPGGATAFHTLPSALLLTTKSPEGVLAWSAKKNKVVPFIYSKMNLISLKQNFLKLEPEQSSGCYAQKKYSKNLQTKKIGYLRDHSKIEKSKPSSLINSYKLKYLKIKIFSTNLMFRFSKKYKIFIFNVIDLFQSVVRSISSFFEKPAEFTTSWIAFGFLVEWSSDLITIIPENVDIYVWNVFSKIIRITPSSLILHNLSILGITTIFNTIITNGYVNTNINNTLQTNFQTIFSNNFFAALALFNHLLQRRIFYLFHTFVETISQPDADLMRRQQKGTLFWDIWADFLVLAADYYNVNVAALSTIKAEQNNLIENISTPTKPVTDFLYTFKNLNLSKNGKAVGTELFATRKNFYNKKFLPVNIKPKTTLLTSNMLPTALQFTRGGGSLMAQSSANFFAFEIKPSAFYTPAFSRYDLPLTNVLTNINRWSVNQYITYQSWHSHNGSNNSNGDLFIDYHPPKSFLHIPAIKYNSILQQPIGTLVCQIYSGIFTKKISKNILLVNPKVSITSESKSNLSGAQAATRKKQIITNYNILLIQALAGETSLKIITDNAQRYALVNRGFAIGIKLLRDVFDAIALNTPCIFLLLDIHAIGQRRPMLISDYGGANSDDNGSFKEDFFGSQRDEVHEKNQVVYQLTRHSITHYRKPFKGDYSFAIPTNLYLNDLFLKSPTKTTSNLSLIENQNFTIKPKINYTKNLSEALPSGPVREAATRQKNSHLQLSKPDFNFSPPSTSPFTVLLLKNSKKLKPNKVVEELPWTGLPGEQLATKPRASYSVRAKVSMLAELSLSNLSAKLDMITDLLVIIDSVRSNKGFVVFATTDVPHILDPALRRPGRLDETICMPTINNSKILNFTTNYEIIKYIKPEQSSGCYAPNTNKISCIYFCKTPLTVNLKDYNTSLNFGYPTENNLLNYALISHSNIIKRKHSQKLANKIGNTPKTMQNIFLRHNINNTNINNINGNKYIKSSKLKYKAIAYYEVGKILLNYYLNNLSKNCAQQPELKRFEAVGTELYATRQKYFTRESGNQSQTWLPVTYSTLKSINYLTLYSSKNNIFKQLMFLFGGKISQLLGSQQIIKKSAIQAKPNLLMFKTVKYNFAQKNIKGVEPRAYGDTISAQVYQENLFNFDISQIFETDEKFQIATKIMLAFIHKRYLYKKNLIVPKLLSFIDGNNLDEPPSPPFSSLLIPAKRFENYKRVFHDSIFGNQIGQRKAQISFIEKIQYHLQFQSIQLLKNRNFYFSKNIPRNEIGVLSTNTESKANNIVKNRLSYGDYKYATNLSGNCKAVGTQLFATRNSVILAQGQENFLKNIPAEKNLPEQSSGYLMAQTPTNINWYYQNRILKRHGQYLTNQWWNGQLSEHNAETVFLSDIDWRSSFIKNKQIQIFPSGPVRAARSSLSSAQVTDMTSENLRAAARALHGLKNLYSLSIPKKQVGGLDVLLDFPDTDQYYNPRRRRWLVNKGYWSFWFNFDKVYSDEIISTWILESIVFTYTYLHNNVELLDFITTKFIALGYRNIDNLSINSTKYTYSSAIKEIISANTLKRFLTYA